jgi:hypothetical protein
MNRNTHLSEAALHDLLIGLGSDASLAHLASCTECSRKAESFREDMQLFNQTTLAWSESRSESRIESRSESRGASRAVRRMQAEPARTAWNPWTPLHWAAAAAVLLLAAGVPVWQRHHAATPMPPPVLLAQEDSPSQIAQDNDLLRSVDAALANTDEPPLEQYNLTRKHERPSTHRPEARNR